jgi:hypothetical protein
MQISETPERKDAGTLYIKGEYDHIRSEASPYYKVGIVRGARDADSRDKALKTGNPRTLDTVFEIQAPFVQKLETRLHNEFAAARVSSGEWFDSSRVSVGAVQKAATKLAGELQEAEEALLFAESKPTPGNLGLLEASAEHLTLLADRNQTVEEIKEIQRSRTMIVKELKVRAKEDPSLYSRFFKTSEKRENTSFSRTELKKLYPKLHSEFSFAAATTFSPEFVRGLDPISTSVESTLVMMSPADFEDPSMSPHNLHRYTLDLWSLLALREWRLDLIEAELLHSARDYAGVEGVLGWKESARMSVDSDALKAQHPEVYDECLVVTKATTTHTVAEWAAYPGLSG